MQQRIDDIQITVVKEVSRGAYFAEWVVRVGEHEINVIARFEAMPYIVYNQHGKRIVHELSCYEEDIDQLIALNKDELLCIFYLPYGTVLPLG